MWCRPVTSSNLLSEKKEKEWDGTEAVPPFPADVTPDNVPIAFHGARGLGHLQEFDQDWSTAAWWAYTEVNTSHISVAISTTTYISYVMHTWFLLVLGFALLYTDGYGHEISEAVHRLMEQADPKARVEYCGEISTGKLDYLLFVITRDELTGVVLVQKDQQNETAIVDADTSLFSPQTRDFYFLGKPLGLAISELLARRNLKRQSQQILRQAGHLQEVSSIGSDIDRVIFPISGFRLGSESSREIIRSLRTAHSISVEPAKAPPGSIIISPTQYTAHGPVSIGHAGIVGSRGLIYSADARFGGAWVQNFTLASWLNRFSASNGTYAFLLRNSPHSKDL
jgi:hypothetical protein